MRHLFRELGEELVLSVESSVRIHEKESRAT
jgi:hypothetical protein